MALNMIQYISCDRSNINIKQSIMLLKVSPEFIQNHFPFLNAWVCSFLSGKGYRMPKVLTCADLRPMTNVPSGAGPSKTARYLRVSHVFILFIHVH